ncbi:DNA ligase D [Guptibacillus algicola]|uniref:DNA ligase D n=1 Tax=Guptibacillus algicola TaxID=225844 RepID=UPI001CD26138|nr:DNA ligase D [Alkalihalobacillus algicola]MCA0987765.1 DNA ligase D [Alkalihalobacillus algicola]
MKEIFTQEDHNFSGNFIIYGYHEDQEEFVISIMRDGHESIIGAFSEGLSSEEYNSLHKTIVENQDHIDQNIVRIAPGICVELSFKGMKNNKILAPTFVSFQLDTDYQECTEENLILTNLPFSREISLTNPSKKYWPNVTKKEYISYLLNVSPLLLPMLKDKHLTVIRYPNGVGNESFYQKNCPDYAPNFIQTDRSEGIDYIICNHLSTLVWLGNQGSIEFHIPFHTIQSNKPVEIVFDLDPPDEKSFDLVILAANEINKIFSSLGIVGFPKLTGSKGIQIHIPIKGSDLTYDDTRIFTSFIANYLVEQHPASFTIERMKKNRKGRLYVDFLQHAEGKTMICPYSTRGKQSPTVAAPLYWSEVNDSLSPTSFTIKSVRERIEKEGCPFERYFHETNPSLPTVIDKLQKETS